MNVAMMLKYKDEVAYMNCEDSISKALELMSQHSYTAVPVINSEGLYVGSVSEGDFLWATLKNDRSKYDEIPIKNILRDGFIKPVNIDADMGEVLLLTMEQNFVPVIDSRKCFVGIVTRRDVISYFYNLTKDKEKETQ